ncbi:ferric reductase transmembrane component 7 [Phlyctema vagabunda]|uniref:ferric-chelate reductase (NADPH) n=1 Tax=Phlyctema vagabunda TaxID=108571 RepID=A0ABR4PTA0_9HELO
MPSVSGEVSNVLRAGSRTVVELARRINIPLTATSPPGLVEANTVDPWSKAGKYALGWTYFCIALVVLVSVTRFYHLWTDKLRQAMYKHEIGEHIANTYYPPDAEYTTSNIDTGRTADQLFPRETEKPYVATTTNTSRWSSIGPVNDTLALFRWIFYRPIPEIKWGRRTIISFPSLAVVCLLIIALAFVTLYCFLPQPLYWQSIAFGSPPLAIRAGMIAIAMTPWIVATSMKANLISALTGIGHDRLGVMHRWGGYLCLFLSLVHAVPFYVQPVWEDGGRQIYQNLFNRTPYVYGTGIAALVPLGWLCIASLPFLRTLAYELFVALHIPVAMLYVGVLFWHCQNYLTSWSYLYATVGIWVLSYLMRIFNLNWLKPWRNAWLIGDEAAVTLLAENAIKVTIPTQMSWKPGQYIYLRMPGISLFENHPFTISSLCSEDFPSEYGDMYRDCTLVFRPFGGFTRKVLNTAIDKGPFKTYRAFLDGPYGGMQRELAAFETVILFAGGSGITAIVSQLLNLIKRMRDGKAVTTKIEVVWALKRLEAMDWFREELRICREYAPPDTVTCQFYVTAAKRETARMGVSERAPRPISTIFHDKLDGFVAGIASKRNSAFIRDEAQGDEEREMELRAENEDAITSLPQAKHLQPKVLPPSTSMDFPPPPKKAFTKDGLSKSNRNSVDLHAASRKFLSPAASDIPKNREFHFPAPAPRADAPHFQFAPPSPRKSPNQQNFPPPPPGPPPQTYRPDSYVSQSSELPYYTPGKDDHYRPESNTAKDAPAPLPPPPTQPHPPSAAHVRQKSGDLQIEIPNTQASSKFDFGFPTTPTEFQKNLMRFAFVGAKKKEGWSTEYGRPELGYMLKEMATGGADGKGIFGRRTCVFVCGPPSMRVDVANTVARLQADIWGDDSKDEIFLHTENYAI